MSLFENRMFLILIKQDGVTPATMIYLASVSAFTVHNIKHQRYTCYSKPNLGLYRFMLTEANWIISLCYALTNISGA